MTGAACCCWSTATVPGLMKTIKQPKYLATYLLKINNKYYELCIKTKTKPAGRQKQNEYQDFLDTLLCDILYLLQNGNINENQYKMPNNRIAEYMSKIKHIN